MEQPRRRRRRSRRRSSNGNDNAADGAAGENGAGARNGGDGGATPMRVDDALWDTCFGVLLAALVIGWLSDLSTLPMHRHPHDQQINHQQHQHPLRHPLQQQQQQEQQLHYKDNHTPYRTGKRRTVGGGIASSSSSRLSSVGGLGVRGGGGFGVDSPYYYTRCGASSAPKLIKLNHDILTTWRSKVAMIDLTISYPSVLTFQKTPLKPLKTSTTRTAKDAKTKIKSYLPTNTRAAAAAAAFDSDITHSNLQRMDIKQFINGCNSRGSMNLAFCVDISPNVVKRITPNFSSVLFPGGSSLSSSSFDPHPPPFVRLIALQPYVATSSHIQRTLKMARDEYRDKYSEDNDDFDEYFHQENNDENKRKKKEEGKEDSRRHSSRPSKKSMMPAMLTEPREGGHAFIVHLKGNAIIRSWKKNVGQAERPPREFHFKNGMRKVLHIPPYWEFNVRNLDKNCTYLLHISSAPMCTNPYR
mmetsp:Transcript_5359/g.10655  ORF Transcript_5359/g.10655 Transcript_5359/m.10655 type:complete len:471 (-) Transcript_5359:331-1743(-)|eukprot:CAMPEP_0170172818 /NCGR_PEP_ID=MMETSP0040_2-20121228/6087_1 /TAXON_ID=641309 /ORGANISM="Lotharella oceanica, Strain CCMP622" /LENGTH=470 /DNA_ID=CAMNT_0010413679 /DNA_START=430 /DNA_END=1842 /DNA_ORIENTATION=-